MVEEKWPVEKEIIWRYIKIDFCLGPIVTRIKTTENPIFKLDILCA
jgi:hypothetical protein